MIVMKFGGTSVESAEAIERIAGIVRERIARRPVVVVSAMGKTTNKLLAIADAAVAGRRGAALGLLDELHKFHRNESLGLGVDDEIDAHFQELAELVKGIAVMGEMTPVRLMRFRRLERGFRVSSSRRVSAAWESMRHTWIRAR